MKINGAQIIVECLKKEGVEHMFGYPGGVVIPIFHQLFNAPFKFILSRHEQGAVHAADGYARASGKPGVVLATSGPGATNRHSIHGFGAPCCFYRAGITQYDRQ